MAPKSRGIRRSLVMLVVAAISVGTLVILTVRTHHIAPAPPEVQYLFYSCGERSHALPFHKPPKC